MSARAAVVAAAAAAALLVLPATAAAHAYLVKTSPASAAILGTPPESVRLTYDEAVEPRFAAISVTDPTGHQLTAGPVSRSPTDPNTLIVPLQPHLARGWYLISWRAISVDGHPVHGAYTFAVGPLPGNPPEFVPPHVMQSATETQLVVMRWLTFLAALAAIGLFALRVTVARPLARLEGVSLKPLTVAFAAAGVVTIVTVAVYVDFSTAVDSLRSVFDLGALVPLYRVTAFGRAWLDFLLCFALFAAAGALAVALDRPRRPLRSVAELLALAGAFAAAAAVLLVPGLAGHAAQTSPRGVSLLLDWLHLSAGAVWVGGLVGLLVLAATLPAEVRAEGMFVAAVRFSPLAIGSVLVLLGTGLGAAALHLPLLAALWQTSYGVTILVKGGLLVGAVAFAALHGRGRTVRPAALAAEALVVVAAVLAAAVLSSLAPPAAALAEESQSLANVGPGRVASTLHVNGYTLQVLVTPNTAIKTNAFALRLSRNGSPVRGADVVLAFAMLDMQMGNEAYRLVETAPGLYERPAPALVMAGRWALQFTITPKSGEPFRALVIDHTTG